MALNGNRKLLRLADMDLATAHHCQAMHPKPIEVICFHCQQAAEKYLKCYLRTKTESVSPRTHDLTELCLLCFGHDESFEEIAKACAKLTIYAVQPRYGDGIELEEIDMAQALQYAAEIKAFAPLMKLREVLDQEDTP